MPRLYVDPARLADPVVVVAGEDHRYLTRVLRVGIGDVVTLFDGQGSEADALIARVGPRALELKVELRRSAVPSERPEVTLIQALTKGDKLDLVVQKATELGVARIIPVTTMRAVPRLEAIKALQRRTRWQKIARDGARQSGRADVPEIGPVSSLGEALAASDGLRVLLYEGARNENDHLKLVLDGVTERPRRITLAVGPEGGFGAEEVDAARAAGFRVVGLGPRILRTETAALVMLSILGYVLGDLG
jgi:16S rRNA (uracil1498-N3)-methyltransferase